MPLHTPVRVGHGVSIGHHGELFQGQTEDHGGERRRCLVSLPCNRFISRARFSPSEGDRIEVSPGKKKAERAFRLTLEHFNAHNIGGKLTLQSNIPERKGYGSSTADCVAAVLAAAASIGRPLSDETVARLVVHAEGASDTVMFHRAVLFAQREGTVIEDYLEPFPRFDALGMDCDENGFVDTMSFPPASYTRREIETFQTLICSLRRAIRTRDLSALGAIATASAAINERFLPKPMFSEIRRLANCCGALGVAVAHSGTVLSILLNPSDPQLERKIGLLCVELSRLRINRTIRFATDRSECIGRPTWRDTHSRLSSTFTDPI